MNGDESKFPLENPRVLTGRIEASLSENSFTDQPLALRFTITLELEAPAGQDAPRIQIAPLLLPIRSWRDLVGTSWTFPERPAMGLSDGQPVPIEAHAPATYSVGDMHTDIVCTRLDFGALEAHHIDATITLVETSSPTKTVAVGDLAAKLEIGTIRILGDVIHVERPGVDAALQLAAPLIDLKDFEARQHGRIVHLHFRP